MTKLLNSDTFFHKESRLQSSLSYLSMQVTSIQVQFSLLTMQMQSPNANSQNNQMHSMSSPPPPPSPAGSLTVYLLSGIKTVPEVSHCHSWSLLRIINNLTTFFFSYSALSVYAVPRRHCLLDFPSLAAKMSGKQITARKKTNKVSWNTLWMPRGRRRTDRWADRFPLSSSQAASSLCVLWRVTAHSPPGISN